jgi:hypothetical protein
MTKLTMETVVICNIEMTMRNDRNEQQTTDMQQEHQKNINDCLLIRINDNIFGRLLQKKSKRNKRVISKVIIQGTSERRMEVVRGAWTD